MEEIARPNLGVCWWNPPTLGRFWALNGFRTQFFHGFPVAAKCSQCAWPKALGKCVPTVKSDPLEGVCSKDDGFFYEFVGGIWLLCGGFGHFSAL